MDLMDQAADVTDFLTEVAIRNKKQELPYTGACHNCGEAIREAAFCDADCREDYDKRVSMNR